MIFRLCLGREPGRPPMGIKAITDYLNRNGHRRRGKLFYTATIEHVLKSIGLAAREFVKRSAAKATPEVAEVRLN